MLQRIYSQFKSPKSCTFRDYCRLLLAGGGWVMIVGHWPAGYIIYRALHLDKQGGRGSREQA